MAIIRRLLRLSRSEGSARVNEAAVHCLGSLSVGEFPHPCFKILMSGLCEASAVKSIELQFTIGQALAVTGMGPKSEAARDRWRWKDTLRAEELSAAKRQKLDPTPITSSVSSVVDTILSDWSRHPLAWRRQAAGIWLVSILKFCRESPELQSKLHRVQGSFSNLLAEGDDFAQDVASKGLGILYDIGDEETKASLVQVEELRTLSPPCELC